MSHIFTATGTETARCHVADYQVNHPFLSPSIVGVLCLVMRVLGCILS